MNKKLAMDFDKVKKFIDKQSKETKFYIGTDSERFKRNGAMYAEYMVVVVVHFDGCHGCRLFGEIYIEEDRDHNKAKPFQRLYTEADLARDMYLKLEELCPDREFEIHLDLNPDTLHGSSCAVKAAVGMIRGTCNVEPLIKPLAMAASFGADRFNRMEKCLIA